MFLFYHISRKEDEAGRGSQSSYECIHIDIPRYEFLGVLKVLCGLELGSKGNISGHPFAQGILELMSVLSIGKRYPGSCY